jgi:hypothetical protein
MKARIKRKSGLNSGSFFEEVIDGVEAATSSSGGVAMPDGMVIGSLEFILDLPVKQKNSSGDKRTVAEDTEDMRENKKNYITISSCPG